MRRAVRLLLILLGTRAYLARPLLVAKGNPDASFVRLMRTGIPLGGSDRRLTDDGARIRSRHRPC